MIKLYKSSYLIILGALLMFCSACDKQLEVKPTKGTGVIITTTSDLDALLNNYPAFYLETNRTAIYSSDDFTIDVNLYNAGPTRFPLESALFQLWDTNIIPNDFAETFWSGEYNKIFQANTVLDNIKRVAGTDQQKADLTADAYLIRAYSYWVLASTYCLPYTSANLNEPGLPIKLLPNYEESLARKTLGETYQQIQSDLNEALKTTVPLVQNGISRHWRASTAGVSGFAARFYLSINDYTNALKYANASLGLYSQLVNYNSGMRNGLPATLTINGNQQATLQFPYTHDRTADFTDMLGWKEFLYFRMLSFSNTLNWYVPSQQLLDLYDKTNDLRYKYHMVQNFSYQKGLVNPAYSFPGYVFFAEDRIPEGPTTSEMYLIKAECLARGGDVSGAMSAINTLHKARTVTGSPDLTASTQADAISVILQERRREMPFRERWFDIKRYNNNGYAADDVPTLSRSFYPYNSSTVVRTSPTQLYTLPPNSRRFAAPIPQSDITNSKGVIVQNTY